MKSNSYCIIMAGGVGSRFWPVSRISRPKQFLDILGTGRSFLQQTYDRFVKIIPSDNIVIVTSEIYKNLVKEQLPEILDENILLEPFRRNTAPCIAYATYKIINKAPDATIVVAPSDHYISNENVFLDVISAALDYASKNDELLTLGIKPTRPETAYGYIQSNINIQKNIEGHSAFAVKTFTEKPDASLAKIFVDSGEFYWNSGIFIWNIETIRRELEDWLPDIALPFSKGRDIYYTDQEQDYILGVYETISGVSIDYGVMEKTDKAWVFQASFGWSDLGTWESLFIHSQKDESNNFIKAEEVMIDKVSNSIIMTDRKDKLMALKGLDNYMIVDTEDVLMICPRDEARFKNLLTDLTVKEKTKFH